VKLRLDNPADVEKGSLFQVKVRVKPNRTGSYRVDVKLPEGFEARERTVRDMKIEAGEEVDVGLDVDATDYLRGGDYTLRAQVRDNRDLPAADDEGEIKVWEPVVIKTPLGSVKLPSIRRIREAVRKTQEMLFNLINNTTHVSISLRWLWAAITLCLFGMLYVYHMWRRRG
jgi:hypothetical protein